MPLNTHLAEEMNIVPAFVPVNLATGANTGDWISLKNYERATFVLMKGVGSATEHPIITFAQATAVAGTGTKALTVTRFYKKSGADLAAIGVYTAVDQAAIATVTGVDIEQSVLVVTIRPEQLDVDGGFDCVQASVADVGIGAQIGAAFWLLDGVRYGVPGLPSAIID